MGDMACDSFSLIRYHYREAINRMNNEKFKRERNEEINTTRKRAKLEESSPSPSPSPVCSNLYAGLDDYLCYGLRETHSVEQAGAKIVYVDTGVWGRETYDARDTIKYVERYEKNKEAATGVPCPRLIFILQDRDYWPWSEEISTVMANRAVKAKAYLDWPRCGEGDPPDRHQIYVPSWYESKSTFSQKFDPALPGTKFIIDNLDETKQSIFKEKLNTDQALWESLHHLLTDFPSSSNKYFFDVPEDESDEKEESDEDEPVCIVKGKAPAW